MSAKVISLLAFKRNRTKILVHAYIRINGQVKRLETPTHTSDK